MVAATLPIAWAGGRQEPADSAIKTVDWPSPPRKRGPRLSLRKWGSRFRGNDKQALAARRRDVRRWHDDAACRVALELRASLAVARWQIGRELGGAGELERWQIFALQVLNPGFAVAGEAGADEVAVLAEADHRFRDPERAADIGGGRERFDKAHAKPRALRHALQALVGGHRRRPEVARVLQAVRAAAAEHLARERLQPDLRLRGERYFLASQAQRSSWPLAAVAASPAARSSQRLIRRSAACRPAAVERR